MTQMIASQVTAIFNPSGCTINNPDPDASFQSPHVNSTSVKTVRDTADLKNIAGRDYASVAQLLCLFLCILFVYFVANDKTLHW